MSKTTKESLEHLQAASEGLVQVSELLIEEVRSLKRRVHALEKRWPSGIWGRTKP